MGYFDRVLLEWRAARARFPDAASHGAADRDAWALETLAVAIAEIGHGELPGKNNRGPDIARYCSPHGDGYLWCAGLGGFCVGTAAEHLSIAMLVKRSLSARQLGENIAAVGRRVDDWRELEPGDFAIFKRTGGYHFTIFERRDADLAHLIEGNHTPLVARNIRQPDRERLAFGASLRLG